MQKSLKFTTVLFLGLISTSVVALTEMTHTEMEETKGRFLPVVGTIVAGSVVSAGIYNGMHYHNHGTLGTPAGTAWAAGAGAIGSVHGSAIAVGAGLKGAQAAGMAANGMVVSGALNLGNPDN